jgi:ABC-type taurine transport system ATPase subunit
MSYRSPEAIHIGVRLAQFFDGQDATQMQVGERYRVSQSRIGRIYAGDFTVRSTTARQMCVDASIPFLDEPADNLAYERNRDRLVRLVDDVWKGTEDDAVFMAEALQAIGKLRKTITKPSGR